MNASVTWGYNYLFKILIQFQKWPSMVVPFVLFWGNALLFSIVTLSVYTPTNSAQVFPFSTSSSMLILPFWKKPSRWMWGDISRSFWFAFPCCWFCTFPRFPQLHGSPTSKLATTPSVWICKDSLSSWRFCEYLYINWFNSFSKYFWPICKWLYYVNCGEKRTENT